MHLRWVVVLAAALLVDSQQPMASSESATQSSSAAAPRTFVTRHSGTFNGTTVRYVATVSETLLKNGKRGPIASLFSIAYVRDDVEDKARRPVIFAFNGGPGSASLWLHLGALGPKRVELPADVNAPLTPPYRLIDNSYSILDVADVVFIDPVETGFSRLLPAASHREFYTAAGDAASIARFIRAWVEKNGRRASPKYVLGESYGTIRAVLLADALFNLPGRLTFDGVILLGQAVNIVETVQRAGNIVGYAVNLPALTAAAWYHGRIEQNGKTLEERLDESYAFATGEYLTALAQGDLLPPDERTRIAERLAALTGLSAGFYLANDLVIDKEWFRQKILEDKGLVVGRNDARYTAPVQERSPDPSMKLAAAFEALVNEHLKTNLKVTLTGDYRALDKKASGAWDYGGPRSPFTDYDFPSRLARLMRAQPALRVMICTGLFDMTTTAGAARYLLARAGLPADRVSSRVYEGGHMFYTNEAALRAMTADVRAFVSPPTLDLLLRPIRGSSPEVTAVEVRAELSGVSAPQEGPFSLRAPITYAGIDGIADTIENVALRDGEGVVQLVTSDDEPVAGGYPYYRHWRAERPLTFPAALTYRVRMHPPGGRRGPPWMLRPSAGGVSAAGSGFLVLPEDTGPFVSRVRWDLGDLAPGSIGVTTFGEGDVEVRGPVGRLMQGWYMAGPVGRFPERGDADGFSATWLGTPPFDPRQEMAWAGKAYAYFRRFFRDTEPRPYRVFMRVLAEPPNRGGTALGNSFMFVMPAQSGEAAGEGPRGTFAHEMIHQWVGGIEGGRSPSETSWFHEGLTTFYTRLLPLRAGLDSIDAYGRSINATARSYYTSRARNLSSEAIGKMGFGDEETRALPYARGALFWADADAKIRAASLGRRRLDDVVLALLEWRRGGQRVDQERLVDALVREIGPSARVAFESVIVRGETIVPDSNGFGPCFERRATKFKTDDAEVDGYEWVRVSSVPDARCRAW